MVTWFVEQRGLSLIGVVIAMLLLSLLGAVMVSVVSTERFVGVNQLQAISAQYAAESGLDRALRYFFDEESGCTTDPNVFNATLGDGNYTVATTLYAPTALPLGAALDDVATNFIVTGDAQAADYAPYGIVIINQEFIECAQVTSGATSTFSGCKRGVGGTTPAAHAAGDQVFQEFCIVNSTGTISAALAGTAQRVVSIGFSQFDLGWAVGDEGTILQWNGIMWSLLADADRFTDRNLRAVQLTALDEAWTAGDWGVMGQWDGMNWSKDRSAHIYLPANGGADIAMLDTDPIEVGQASRVVNITGLGGVTEVALTPNGKYLYVTRWGNNDVVVIDTDTRSQVLDGVGDPLTITVGTNPRGIAVSPDGMRVYVVNEGSQDITIIDRVDDTNPAGDVIDPLSPITLDANYPPRYAAITLDGSKLFVTTSTTQPTGRLEVITGLPGAPVVKPGGIPLVDEFGNPETNQWGIAIHPSDYYAYVAGRATDRVYAIDVLNESVNEAINVGGEPWGIGYTRDGLEAYVSKNDVNRVLALDTASNVSVADIDTFPTVSAGPQGLVGSADGSEFYVANVTAGQVNLIRVQDKTNDTDAAESIAGLTGGIAAHPARSFKSISMLSPTEGWAVGGDGRILRWNSVADRWITQPLVTFDIPDPPAGTEDNGNGTWTTTIRPDPTEGDAYVRMNDDVGCGVGTIGCTNFEDYGTDDPDRLGLRRVYEDSNNPNEVGDLLDPNNPNQKLYRPYLKFDLSTVKQYALSVLGASLQLYAYDAEPAPSGTTTVGSGLVLRYEFEEGSGTDINDSSGFLPPNSGTNYCEPGATDCTNYTVGIEGLALEFDGLDDRVIAPPSSSLRISDTLTVETWVNFTDPSQLIDGVSRELIRKGIKKNRLSYMLWTEYGKPAFTVRISCGFNCGIRFDAISADPVPLDQNRWYHLVGTYDGETLKIYQDGILKGQTSATGTIFTGGGFGPPPPPSKNCGNYRFYLGTTIAISSDALCVGGAQGADFDGFLDESRIYNRALSAEEIGEESGWGARVVTVYRNVDPWFADSIAGESQPGSAEADGSTVVTTGNIPNPGKWVYWSATRLVQRWVDDTNPNYGLVLRVDLDAGETDPSPGGILWFYSADVDPLTFPPGQDWRPRLVVTYRVSNRPNLEGIAMLDTDGLPGADDGWAVGEAGIMFRYDLRADPLNLTWSQWATADQTANGGAALPTNGLKSVSMQDNAVGWAVGDGGMILHYDAGYWRQVQAGLTTEDLTAVSITPDGQGIAVGKNGTILRYNGTWEIDNDPLIEGAAIVSNLTAFEAFSQAKGWGVGEDGTIIRKLGGKWTGPGHIPTTETLTPNHLRGIDMLPSQTTITDWREEY